MKVFNLGEVLFKKGVLLKGFGRFEEALEILDQSLKITPGNQDALREKADVLESLVRKNDAEKIRRGL